MAAIYAIIVMAFINGNLVDDPVVLMSDAEHVLTAKNCPDYAHKVLDHVRGQATSDVQLVAKCVDFAQLPLTLSVFGSKAK